MSDRLTPTEQTFRTSAHWSRKGSAGDRQARCEEKSERDLRRRELESSPLERGPRSNTRGGGCTRHVMAQRSSRDFASARVSGAPRGHNCVAAN